MTAVAWPKALGEPQQGDDVWGVYLALAHSTAAPALEKAQQEAAAAGYAAVIGDLACDQGAMEALRLDPFDLWGTAALYFATKAQASSFVQSYRASGRKVVGMAKVGVGCLD